MTLNDMMEFDHVIRVNPDGTVTDATGLYAPEVTVETDNDGQILDSHEQEMTASVKAQGWDLLRGWTGQYSYSGPIMHTSEYIGGALADYIRETPGYYVVVIVDILSAAHPMGNDIGESIDSFDPNADEFDTDVDEAGWVIAYRSLDTIPRT